MKWLLFSLGIILAGCSGGGSATTDALTPAGDTPGSPGSGVATASSLPVTGRASYSGQLMLGLERAGNPPGVRTPYVGALSMDVAFGGTDAQLTGVATNFSAAGGAPVVGNLFFTRGVIDRAAAESAPDYSGRLSGTLRDGTTGYLVFGQFFGEFKGSAQEAISGEIAGNVLQGSTQTQFDGSYLAGRTP